MMRSLRAMRLSFTLLVLVLLLAVAGAVRAQDLPNRTGVVVRPPTTGGARTTPSRRRDAPASRTRSGSTRPAARPSAAAAREQVEEALAEGDAALNANPADYAYAEEQYQLASRLAPRDARPHSRLGTLYNLQTRYAQAETALRQAVNLNPSDPQAYVLLAFALNNLERYREAVGVAQRAVALAPDHAYAQAAFGWSQFRLRNYAEAEAAYARALTITPQDGGLNADLALILFEQRRWSDALAPLQRAVSVDANSIERLHLYGVVLQKLGRLDEAAQQYERIIRINNQVSPARSNLALIHYMRGAMEQAREQWQTAIRLGSNYPPDRIGMSILTGQLAEARTQLEQYARANAEDEDGWLMLGDVLNALGDAAGARSAYRNAAAIAPDYARLPRPTLGRTATPNAPASSSAAPRSAPISGGVLNGRAISLPTPAYPPAARAAGAQGTVTVQVLVDEEGKVIAARAVNGHPLLRQAAVEAANQARFAPTMVAGRPVRVSGVVTYNFRR